MQNKKCLKQSCKVGMNFHAHVLCVSCKFNWWETFFKRFILTALGLSAFVWNCFDLKINHRTIDFIKLTKGIDFEKLWCTNSSLFIASFYCLMLQRIYDEINLGTNTKSLENSIQKSLTFDGKVIYSIVVY